MKLIETITRHTPIVNEAVEAAGGEHEGAGRVAARRRISHQVTRHPMQQRRIPRRLRYGVPQPAAVAAMLSEGINGRVFSQGEY